MQGLLSNVAFFLHVRHLYNRPCPPTSFLFGLSVTHAEACPASPGLYDIHITFHILCVFRWSTRGLQLRLYQQKRREPDDISPISRDRSFLGCYLLLRHHHLLLLLFLLLFSPSRLCHFRKNLEIFDKKYDKVKTAETGKRADGGWGGAGIFGKPCHT